MDTPVFNSRSARYKTPYGAVPCGTEITLTLRPAASLGFSACYLVLCHEFAQSRRMVELSPVPSDTPGCLCFTGSYTAPQEPELTWYSFRFLRPNGQEIGRAHV